MGRKQGYRKEQVGTTEWLVVRAPREWPTLIFLCVWLTGWSFGGLFAIAMLFAGGTDTGGSVFLGVWLCGWTLGWVFAAVKVYWHIAGSIRIAVEGTTVVHIRGMPGIRKVREYEASQLSGLRALSHGVEFDDGKKVVLLLPTRTSAEAREVMNWLTWKLPARALEK